MRMGLKLLCGTLAGVALLWCASPAVAQEEDSVTQEELASMLTKALGLETYLSPTATPMERYKILALNGVTPLDGWKGAEVVTVNTLAVAMVQALGLTAEVEDPADPASYVSVLQQYDIPMDTVSDGIGQVGLIDTPVASAVIGANADPAYKRTRFNPVDELSYGVDAFVVSPMVGTVEVVTVMALPEAAAAPSTKPREPTSPI